MIGDADDALRTYLKAIHSRQIIVGTLLRDRVHVAGRGRRRHETEIAAPETGTELTSSSLPFAPISTMGEPEIGGGTFSRSKLKWAGCCMREQQDRVTKNNGPRSRRVR